MPSLLSTAGLNEQPITLVLISDTHSCHSSLDPLPEGDILIHAGDITEHGTIKEIEEFVQWFSTLPYKYKIFVAGNHDHSLEPGHTYRSALRQVDGRFDNGEYVVAKSPEESVRLIQSIDLLQDTNTIYLRPDRATVTVKIRDRQLVVHGSPCTPLSFGPNAFMRERSYLDKLWLDAPMSDVLVSHAPPRGLLDQALNGRHLGCDGLKSAVERTRPRLVVCGHVHEARGVQHLQWDETSTTVVNAAVMNRSKAIQWGAQLIVI
ncbi:MAG: hypothetical protein M1837_002720 [Sclerophora amabilis]|nr:MAG: hypothetical protein M1837_002720 [Sclerophora amabilis]